MYLPANVGGQRSHGNEDINSYTSKKAELTASICHIERFLKSTIPIYNSEVSDTAQKKREKEDDRHLQGVMRFRQTQLESIYEQKKLTYYTMVFYRHFIYAPIIWMFYSRTSHDSLGPSSIPSICKFLLLNRSSRSTSFLQISISHIGSVVFITPMSFVESISFSKHCSFYLCWKTSALYRFGWNKGFL